MAGRPNPISRPDRRRDRISGDVLLAVRVVTYRHAAYDAPWWAFPSSRQGRFHRAQSQTVQYLSLHPLGPSAEMLRHNVGPGGDPTIFDSTCGRWTQTSTTSSTSLSTTARNGD